MIGVGIIKFSLARILNGMAGSMFVNNHFVSQSIAKPCKKVKEKAKPQTAVILRNFSHVYGICDVRIPVYLKSFSKMFELKTIRIFQ